MPPEAGRGLGTEHRAHICWAGLATWVLRVGSHPPGQELSRTPGTPPAPFWLHDGLLAAAAHRPAAQRVPGEGSRGPPGSC